MRLVFEGSTHSERQDVYLFMNDQDGQNEECFLFRIQTGGGIQDEIDL